MIGALTAMAVSTLVSGISYVVEMDQSARSGILIAMTMLFIGGFETGPGPLFFVMASESFNPLIKSEGIVLCNTLAWIFNITIVFVFPLLDAGLMEFVLTGVCLLAIALIYFLVPETKSVNVEAVKAADEEKHLEQGDELTVEQSVKSRVVACCFVGILSGALYGYQTCVVSGLTKPLLNVTVSPYDLTFENGTIYTPIFTTDILVGGMIGSFSGTPIADRWGRRVGIIVCALFGLIPSITLSTIMNYWAAVASRTVQGVAVGMSCVIAPMYVAEVAPIKRRGSLGTLFQVSICSAILVSELLNYILQPDPNTNKFPHNWYWQIQFAGGALFAGLLLLYAIFGMPESEVWKKEHAERVARAARSRTASSASAQASLLQNDHLAGSDENAGKGMGSKTPSQADMLKTPRGVEWKTTTSWDDLQKAAGGLQAAIRRSFNDLKGLDTKDGE